MSALGPLRRLADTLDRQSRRERAMLGLAIAVVLVLVWDIGLRGPLAQRHQAALERVERTRADIERLQASAERLAEQIDAGGRDDEAAAAIERRLARVDAQITARTQRIIAPAEMVRVLRDVLADEERLRLIALQNAGVEPIAIDGSSSGADQAADLPTIYRHRVELTVEGRYFALLAYLERLEGLRWRFHWDALQIETTEYPTARATLSLSTLSLAEDWRGV